MREETELQENPHEDTHSGILSFKSVDKPHIRNLDLQEPLSPQQVTN
jgi:hypothetical protein